MMGKLILGLAIAFCALQLAEAKFQLDSLLFENIRFDLSRKCAGVERDFDKDFANIKHKVMKETVKLSKKGTNRTALDCIEALNLKTNVELNDEIQEFQKCVQDLKDTLESDIGPESSLQEVFAFRNIFKTKLNECKQKTKMNLKVIQNNFQMQGKTCMV